MSIKNKSGLLKNPLFSIASTFAKPSCTSLEVWSLGFRKRGGAKNAISFRVIASSFRLCQHYLLKQTTRSCNMLIQKQRFTNVLNLGNRAFKVERFRQNDLEDLFDIRRVRWRLASVCRGQSYLLHVYAVACATKYQACTHCPCKTSCLLTELGPWAVLTKGSCHTCTEISSWSSLGKFTKWSYLVPTKNGIAVLLKPRPCLYHSLIEFNVLFLVKSNMNSIATASLQTRGSILTNSRCPPRSHIENVISVFRIEIVFSIKLTPWRS